MSDENCVEHPNAATAEKLGRAAGPALAELLGSSLAGPIAQPVVAGGSTVDKAIESSETESPAEPRGPSVETLPKEHAPGAERTLFALDAVVAAEALLDAIDGYPKWFDQRGRNELLKQLVGLLEIDPSHDDPTLPHGDHSSTMYILRIAVLIDALVALLEWTPRDDDLDKSPRAALMELKPLVQVRLAELAATLAEAVVREKPHRWHSFFSFRVIRALRRAQEKLNGRDQPQAIKGSSTGSSPKQTTQEASDEHTTTELVAPANGATKGSSLAGITEDASRAALGIGEALEMIWVDLRTQLDEKLVRHQLGLMNSGEIVALAFGGAAAAVYGPPAARYAAAAIRASLDVSDVATGWAEGRVVAVESNDGLFRRSLAVPAPEVFSAVAEALLVSLGSGQPLGVANQLHDALGRGLELLDNTLLEPPPDEGQLGWADELFDGQSASLWSTAAALRLAVASSDVASQRAREKVFERYETLQTSGRDWPKFLEWNKYWQENEPDCKAQLLRYIHEEIVEPRRRAGRNSRVDPSVALLFGPPGTTKTTIARGVGNGLGWPVVNLSPANFIDEGLDAIERRAHAVFADLRALSRAVVILDEADELFRKRRPVPENEALRGVTAFMTASMLPRLQDLHDRGRIVLFICTNFLSSIDGAMRRVGRVDHLIAVPPPDEEQRRAMIRRALLEELADKVPFLDEAIESLTQHTSKFIRGELLPAARKVATIATSENGFDNADAAKAKAKEVAERRRETIAISDSTEEDVLAWDEFMKDLEVLSAPRIKSGESSWPEEKS